MSMSAELRQVANGCAYRVKSFGGYDVNGYHFHTIKAWAGSTQSKNHKYRSFYPRRRWDRVLWKNRRNIRTHISWFQNSKTSHIQMSLVWSSSCETNSESWPSRNSTVVGVRRRRCLYCGSTGHASLLSLIPMPNRWPPQRLGCCVQGIVTR